MCIVVTLLCHLMPDMDDVAGMTPHRGRELGSGLEAGWPNAISSCAGAQQFLKRRAWMKLINKMSDVIPMMQLNLAIETQCCLESTR